MNARLDTIPTTSNASPALGRAVAALLHTDDSLGQTLLRLALGVVIFTHGAQHLLGWFGGYGFAGTLGWMTGVVGIPAPIAAAGIVLEFVAPLALIVGAGSRLAGLALAVFMTVAASTHVATGFFMNWGGALPAGAEGFEFHVLAVAMALAIAVRGGGALSLDRLLLRRAASRQ